MRSFRFSKPALAMAAALAVTAGTLAAAAPAFARPSTLAMTCAQARATVIRHGAIVLGTGGYSYDRYVSDRRFCEVGEATRPEWVPTRDNPQCLVGYTCFTPSFGDRTFR